MFDYSSQEPEPNLTYRTRTEPNPGNDGSFPSLTQAALSAESAAARHKVNVRRASIPSPVVIGTVHCDRYDRSLRSKPSSVSATV